MGMWTGGMNAGTLMDDYYPGNKSGRLEGGGGRAPRAKIRRKPIVFLQSMFN